MDDVPEATHGVVHADVFSVYGDLIWLVLAVFLFLFFLIMYRAKLNAQRLQAQVIAEAQLHAHAQAHAQAHVAQQYLPRTYTIDRQVYEQQRKTDGYDDLPPKYEDVMANAIVMNPSTLQQSRPAHTQSQQPSHLP